VGTWGLRPLGNTPPCGKRKGKGGARFTTVLKHSRTD
jgi:hypothetical protein